MTLNILFFTITLKKRAITLDEEIHREMVEKRMQEINAKYCQIMGRY